MRQLLGGQLLRTLSGADEGTLLSSLRKSLGERQLALCFHRVGPERDKLCMPSQEIDRLVAFCLEARGELTVSFDDGYRGAADYLLSRAQRWPQIEWLYFVCPQKTEQRAEPELAEIERCLEIARLPNAALGNHTNTHRRLSLLSPDDVLEELSSSQRDFERLFGPQLHFAVPFGVPGVDFCLEHVDELRSLGEFVIWSTEPRPFHARERRTGSVLPRFAVDGRRRWKETAVHIALHALRTRVLGDGRP